MYIVSISVNSRNLVVPEIQNVLTKYGEKISTRLGMHDSTKENRGVIIVSYIDEDIDQFVEELNGIPDTRCKLYGNIKKESTLSLSVLC